VNFFSHFKSNFKHLQKTVFKSGVLIFCTSWALSPRVRLISLSVSQQLQLSSIHTAVHKGYCITTRKNWNEHSNHVQNFYCNSCPLPWQVWRLYTIAIVWGKYLVVLSVRSVVSDTKQNVCTLYAVKPRCTAPICWTAICGSIWGVTLNQNTAQCGISVHMLSWALSEGGAILGFDSIRHTCKMGSVCITLWHVAINIYTSLPIQTAQYHFTQREHFCGDVITLATIKCTQFFTLGAQI
jgi:hypothetical protein